MAKSNPKIERVNIVTATPDSQLVVNGFFEGSLTGVTNIAGVYAPACILHAIDTGICYQNIGTTASPNFAVIDTSFGGLPALLDGRIWVGNSSNVATAVLMSGDVTITNAGVAAIAAGVIVNADINASAAIAFSKLAALTSAQILVGSAGNVATAVALSGDGVISNVGALRVVSVTDANGNQLLSFTTVAAAINEITISNNSIGLAPIISATGDDTNINITLTPKGTGGVVFPAGAAATPSIRVGAAGVGLYLPAANTLGFVTTGTERARFTSAGNLQMGATFGITSASDANARAPFFFAAATQSISGPGAISITTYATEITTTGADAFTLADGTVVGQLKRIKLIVDGGDATITPTSPITFATIVLSVVGDQVLLQWTGTGWALLSDDSVLGNGATPTYT